MVAYQLLKNIVIMILGHKNIGTSRCIKYDISANNTDIWR